MDKMIPIWETTSGKHRQYKLYCLDWCYGQARPTCQFTIKLNTYYAGNICKDKTNEPYGSDLQDFLLE